MRKEKFNRETILFSGEYGKIPPQNVEAEELVLATLILFKDTIYQVRKLLPKPDYFYKEPHQRIYAALCEMSDRGEDIDLLTVTFELRKKGELEICGGAGYITGLTTRINSEEHLVAHAAILRELWSKREQITLAMKMMQQAYEDSTASQDILTFSHKALGDIQSGLVSAKERNLKDIFTSSLKRAESSKSKPENVFITTGNATLDHYIGGFRSPSAQLIFVIARPAMGKSALIGQAAKANGLRGIPVGVITLEMEAEDWTNRWIVSNLEGKYTNFEFTAGRFDINDLEHIQRVGSEMMALPIYLYDPPFMEMFEIRLKAIEWKERYGIRLLIIDYLQLIRYSTEKEMRLKITYISHELKALAKELSIPILVVSSLSRDSEKRGNKRVMMSDIRESGDVEFDADIIIAPYRPGYYDKDNKELEYVIEFDILKNRGGWVGSTSQSYYDPATNRYSNVPFDQSFESPLPPKPHYKQLELTDEQVKPPF